VSYKLPRVSALVEFFVAQPLLDYYLNRLGGRYSYITRNLYIIIIIVVIVVVAAVIIIILRVIARLCGIILLL